MVRNLVMYNVKPGSDSAEIGRFTEAARRLFLPLPYVIDVQVGRSVTHFDLVIPTREFVGMPENAKSYEYTLCVDLPDKASHRAYLLSDEHTEYVRDYFGPLVNTYLSFVYEAE